MVRTISLSLMLVLLGAATAVNADDRLRPGPAPGGRVQPGPVQPRGPSGGSVTPPSTRGPTAPGVGRSGVGKTPAELLAERRARAKSERERGATTERAGGNEPIVRRVQPRSGSLVGLQEQKVRFVADLARVDLTLSIENVGTSPVEWRQTYAMDSLAEVVGAVLQRVDMAPVNCRTLTIADARRIYDEARMPRRSRSRRAPTRPRSPADDGTATTRDPLRLERVARDQLEIIVWPVAPQETVQISLTFVTPLRGKGQMRTFVDPLGGEGPRRLAPSLRPTAPTPDGVKVTDSAVWTLDPRGLILDSDPTGMTLESEGEDGVLRFVGVKETSEQSGRPSVPFLIPGEVGGAIAVKSGTFGGRMAIWRFDPTTFLREHGIEGGATLRLVDRKGTSRIAPHVFAVNGDSLPVTARVKGTARKFRYAVQVLDEAGKVVSEHETSMAILREKYDSELEGTISGWHRASMVRRVFSWAGQDEAKRASALRYAVDVGVLVPGTAALAVPPKERALLSAASRRLYFQDGAPLGAQRREADMKSPPEGSVK